MIPKPHESTMNYALAQGYLPTTPQPESLDQHILFFSSLRHKVRLLWVSCLGFTSYSFRENGERWRPSRATGETSQPSKSFVMWKVHMLSSSWTAANRQKDLFLHCRLKNRNSLVHLHGPLNLFLNISEVTWEMVNLSYMNTWLVELACLSTFPSTQAKSQHRPSSRLRDLLVVDQLLISPATKKNSIFLHRGHVDHVVG